MTDKTITALTVAGAISGTDLLTIVQGGNSRKVAWSALTAALGVAAATSLAIGGATIGSNALAVTGTAIHSDTISIGGASVGTVSNQLLLYGSNASSGGAPVQTGRLEVHYYSGNAISNVVLGAGSAGATNIRFQVDGVTAHVGTNLGGTNNSAFTVQRNTIGGPAAFNLRGPTFESTGSGANTLFQQDDVAIQVQSSTNLFDFANSTNGQMVRVSNTTDNSSTGGAPTNYERGLFGYSSNIFYSGTQKGGTGAARASVFGSNVTGNPDAAVSLQGTAINFIPTSAGTTSWSFDTSNALKPMTDNTYNIGYINFRVGTGFFTTVSTTTMQAIASGAVGWNGRSEIRSPSDGVLTLYNNADTDFTRLQLGGTTSSFPAIARDGAGTKFVGGDGTSVSWIKVPGVTVANLPAAATAGVGAVSFVTDANTTFILGLGATVVGGGTGKVPVYSDGTNWIIG